MPTDPTLAAAPERNRYFYGLLMDAERFRKDQDYFNTKRRLLNRFVAGAGVLRGLGLTFDSAKGTLALAPGIAIDLAGREILVPTATPVDLSQLTDAQGKKTSPVPAGSTVLISLAYAERQIDPVAVLVPDCDQTGACAPSTIEEGFAILVRVVTAAARPLPKCPGSFLLPPGLVLQTTMAEAIAKTYIAAPADTSIALGRLTLPGGPLDAVSDRPIVYDNTLLFDLIICLAEQVSKTVGVALAYVSGDNQTGAAGGPLAHPLVVGLVDGSGNPVTSGSLPTFTVTGGGGSVGTVTAAGPGQYEVTWTLGTSGAQTVTAQSEQSSLVVTFHASIQ
jgi:hypothetical protein